VLVHDAESTGEPILGIREVALEGAPGSHADEDRRQENRQEAKYLEGP
jgi:hypothetical protein